MEVMENLTPLLSKKPKECKVAFIPTAADPLAEKGFLEKCRQKIRELGLKVEDVDLKEYHQEDLFGRLSFFDVIYVCGGNTFYLLDWVRRSGLDRVIEPLLSMGKVYVGGSAGSYLACPSIEVSSWKGKHENIPKIKDLSALNLVPFLIFAHFTESWRPELERWIKKTKHPLVALTDQQAIQVKAGQYKIVGKGKPLFFNGAEKIFKE